MRDDRHRHGGREALRRAGLSAAAETCFKQGVALTGRNRTVPPCSVDRRTGHALGPAAADRPHALQTTTDDADRRKNDRWLQFQL